MSRLSFPVFVATLSALIWGLWWVPLLWLEGLGLTGLWAGAALNAGAVPLCLAYVFWQEGDLRMAPRTALGAACVGGALTLYSGAIIETTVVRAVLIFYLAPAWAIALECAFFGRRFRLFNLATFGLAALGFLAIFRFELDLTGLNSGDVMALISGICWAVGAALIFSDPKVSAPRLALVTALTGTILATCLALAFQVEPLGSPPARAYVSALAVGSLYIAPIMVMTLWSARRLPPATVTFLLTAEVISGVASAALLLDAPFGLWEVAGATLIIAAALSEVVFARQVPGQG